jgi:hypothetical protein
MNSKADEYNTEPLARVLLAVAGLLGAFIFLEVATFFVRAADADGIVAQARDTTLGRPAGPSAEVKAAVEGLKKNNLFAPAASKQYPISEVTGILGSQALINGQWYKAGDIVADRLYGRGWPAGAQSGTQGRPAGPQRRRDGRHGRSAGTGARSRGRPVTRGTRSDERTISRHVARGAAEVSR